MKDLSSDELKNRIVSILKYLNIDQYVVDGAWCNSKKPKYYTRITFHLNHERFGKNVITTNPSDWGNDIIYKDQSNIEYFLKIIYFHIKQDLREEAERRIMKRLVDQELDSVLEFSL